MGELPARHPLRAILVSVPMHPLPPLLCMLAISAGFTSAASADVDWLAPGRTFQQPLADPRWPRFSASWQEYRDDPFLDSAAAVSLGGTFALVRERPVRRATPSWELGLQAAVFATFEPLEGSQDLFNSDWQVGAYLARRAGPWSGMLRLWHQSSHLGDEFLLRNPGFPRVNFTFESLSGLLAYDTTSWSRIYGGGGWLFDETPADFGNWFIQYGLELSPPFPVLGGRAHPFIAIDVQHYEATDWQADVSLVTGVHLGDSAPDDLRMSVYLELYDGRNPNGQFFDQDARYLGLGLQLRL